MQSRLAHLLLKNGLAAMLVALVGGFALTFFMIGGLSLPPTSIVLPLHLPGTLQGWRAVHTGTMLNGVMAVAIALAMPRLILSEFQARLVAYGTITAIWGNTCFYVMSQFAPNHGLTLQGNTLGPASLAGTLAFLPAFAGAITLIAALITLLRAKAAH